VARAKRDANEEHLAIATSLVSFVEMALGAFEPAAEGFERATDLFESLAEPEPGPKKFYRLSQQIDNDCWSGWNLWFLGYPDKAFERCRGAIALARESGSKPLLEMANNYAFEVDHLRRDSQQVRARGEATLALALELGNLFRRAVAEMFLGWEDILSGDYGRGLPRMQENLDLFKATGSVTMSMYMLALIASALGYKQQFDEGLSTIEQAFPTIEQTDERFYEAEIYRLKGELLVAQDASNAAQAEQCFRTAIDIARTQKAKSWELRATTSLARLLDKQGRRDEARAMLAEIYNWFTEGFDTADLKDAKALLEELANSR
jgi:tetratricopeptide (TPR) repeat protein